jgi:ABC-2 type transport system permease protein
MFLLAFSLTSFGIVLANRIKSFEAFGVFSNAVILPLYFTSSSVFPLDPALVQINPLTYAVDSLRGVFIHFHQFDPLIGPAVLAAGAVLFFLIALWDFRRL